MNDIARDEHLRAALRHAPDAALAAPADISAQILAAAHRAAAEPATAAPPPHRRWWALQTPWRLGTSGAFATLLLAGVVGLIWHGETPGPATEASVELAAHAPAPTPPPVQAPAPAAAQPAPVLERAADASKPTPPPKKALRKQDDPDPRSDAMAQRQRSPAAKEEKDVARDETRRVAQLKEESTRVESRLAANAVQAAPAPPPPAAPAPAVLAAAEPAVAAAARKPMADATGTVTLGRAAPAGVAAPALMAAPRPSGPWMDALAAGPAVRWTVDGEARAPTSSWLYALAEQTQGRWRPAPDARPVAGDKVVAWKRGDQPLGQLWLGAERVLWCDAKLADGRCEEAALAPDVASALRKGLAR